MKSIIVLLIVLVQMNVCAQNIAVNTDGSQPDNSAILDIKSNSKGLLVPRLTTLQRTSIAGPAMGLTVFDTETFSYWMYRGDVNGGWAELQHNFQNLWSTVGNNIYRTNTGNVTVGPYSALDAELKLNGIAPRFAFLNDGVQKGFIRAFADDFKFGTYAGNSGKIIFSPKGVDKIWIDENGQMGIGTATPSSQLTINGSSPYIEMMHNNVNTGFLMASGVNLKLGTNSTNTTGNVRFQTQLIDRMTIDENGLVGIGTTNPTSILSINSTDPIVQLKNAGVDKGFVQLVNDDIKIGTNIDNDNGKFIVRTNGTDRLTVNNKGQMGLNVIPDDIRTSFSVGEDENGNTGIELVQDNIRRGMFNFNGIVTTLSANAGDFHIYRKSTDPFIAHTDGNFTMGGWNVATGYRFSIYGKAIAYEFTALPYASWPDYVFADNYKLRPLSEVKKFISENKHLPNIPAAAEVEKNGIQLGDMSKRLMEKVEELTLYVIQLQEQVDELKKKTTNNK